METPPQQLIDFYAQEKANAQTPDLGYEMRPSQPQTIPEYVGVNLIKTKQNVGNAFGWK